MQLLILFFKSCIYNLNSRENKIWKVQLPKDKQYAMEMEFRSAGWRTTFLYDEKQTKTFYSYSLHGDTIKVFESGKIVSFKNLQIVL